jgi:hypothetical protein
VSPSHLITLTEESATMPRRYTSIPVDHLFWSIVNPVLGDDRCWAWPKGRNKCGYGLFRLRLSDGHKEALAHRVAWILTYGAIPPEKRICHTCDTPACCRPSHLWIGTHAENMHDMAQKKRVVSRTKNGAWSRAGHRACIACGTTTKEHEGHGLCFVCVGRARRARAAAIREHLKSLQGTMMQKTS